MFRIFKVNQTWRTRVAPKINRKAPRRDWSSRLTSTRNANNWSNLEKHFKNPISSLYQDSPTAGCFWKLTYSQAKPPLVGGLRLIARLPSAPFGLAVGFAASEASPPTCVSPTPEPLEKLSCPFILFFFGEGARFGWRRWVGFDSKGNFKKTLVGCRGGVVLRFSQIFIDSC